MRGENFMWTMEFETATCGVFNDACMSICSSGVWLVNAAALSRDDRHNPEPRASRTTVRARARWRERVGAIARRGENIVVHAHSVF